VIIKQANTSEAWNKDNNYKFIIVQDNKCTVVFTKTGLYEDGYHWTGLEPNYARPVWSDE